MKLHFTLVFKLLSSNCILVSQETGGKTKKQRTLSCHNALSVTTIILQILPYLYYNTIHQSNFKTYLEKYAISNRKLKVK